MFFFFLGVTKNHCHFFCFVLFLFLVGAQTIAIYLLKRVCLPICKLNHRYSFWLTVFHFPSYNLNRHHFSSLGLLLCLLKIITCHFWKVLLVFLVATKNYHFFFLITTKNHHHFFLQGLHFGWSSSCLLHHVVTFISFYKAYIATHHILIFHGWT